MKQPKFIFLVDVNSSCGAKYIMHQLQRDCFVGQFQHRYNILSRYHTVIFKEFSTYKAQIDNQNKHDHID